MVSTPRLYAIVATRAPVAVIFRRGPSKWWLVIRWDLATGNLEPGARLGGTLYPRRCDLSPDGTLLSYFVLGARAFMGGSTYSAISKLPWLFALAAWPELGTYTRGYHFVDGPSEERPAGVSDADLRTRYGLACYEEWEVPAPEVGTIAPLRYGLARTDTQEYAVERRRGWLPQKHGVLSKSRPTGRDRLILSDRGWDVRGDAIEGKGPTYELERHRDVIALDDVTWADWDQTGRLLVATRRGRVQILDVDTPKLDIIVEHDLASLHQPRMPAPEWARRW